MFTNSEIRITPAIQTQRSNPRQGLALVMVLIAISTSLILTLGFLRTQNTVLHLSQNTRHQDLALQAARTGASIALHDLQSPTWSGVDQTLQRRLAETDDGVTQFVVEYLPLKSNQYPDTKYHETLYLVLRSTGSWTAHADNRSVRKTIEVLVELQPRLSPVVDTDSGPDVAENPSEFTAIRHMALFADEDRSSISLGPAHRIEGSVWIRSRLRLFDGPEWSKQVRAEVMRSIGNHLALPPEPPLHPHPLSGQVHHARILSSATRNSLKLLKTPSQRAGSRLSRPKLNISDHTSYSIYQGGPTYAAVQLPSLLENTKLTPTADNPLGVYYRNGNLKIGDQVTVQGTLLVKQKLLISGQDVHLCSYDWRGRDGESQVPNIEQWPRLPAIVTNTMIVQRDVRLIVEGAILCEDMLDVRAGDLDKQEAPLIDIQGLATSQAVEQPHSLVTITSATNLRSVASGGVHAIWLGSDRTGNWFPIIRVDAKRNELMICGHVTHNTDTPFRIRRSRLRFVDIRGPVSGHQHRFLHPPAWTLNRTLWSQLRESWSIENQIHQLFGQGQVPFIDWLSDPSNFYFWPEPYSEWGLNLEPTVHLRSTPLIAHHMHTPLFRPFPGLTDNDPEAGYRWQVISWRESP